MKEKSSSKKTLIILGIVILAGLLIYFYSSGTPDDSSVSLLDGGEDSLVTSEAQIAGSRVLALLNQINSLKIDPSIFENPAYRSLIDYSIAIPEQNIGRANPFAPISK